MNLLRFFRREPRPPQTAPAARERLQILLTHERSSGSQPDLVAILREEILAVVGKHVKIDPGRGRGEAGSRQGHLDAGDRGRGAFRGRHGPPAPPAHAKPVQHQHKKANNKKRRKAA
jgi:cell division topological specificity factor MinE